VVRLNFETGLLKKQMKDGEKRKEREERAVNRLEEANRKVTWVFKLDTAARIRKDVIEDFLEKGGRNYHCIFGAVTKFAKDVDKSLTEFKDALWPMAGNLRDLSSQKPERRFGLHMLEDSDNDAQARRRKGKIVLSGSDEDVDHPSPEKISVEEKKLAEEKKPKKEEIPVPTQMEADSEMQEAQGPDVAAKEDI
jgi:hypothetical protein